MTAGELILWLGRLALAGCVGGLLGLERESRGHPAGAPTQALVAIGAALFTMIGERGFSGEAVDGSRVAAQVVSGIGFIGAGVILKNGGSIRGLTTAATLWVSAALGMAAGTGEWQAAVAGAAIALAFMYGLRLLRPWLTRRRWQVLHLEYDPGHGTLGPLLRGLERIEGEVGDLHITDETDPVTGGQVRTVSVKVGARDAGELEALLRSLDRRPEIHHVRIEAETDR
jgi:putative Mg2+ transporter-C (MgtC) family protein